MAVRINGRGFSTNTAGNEVMFAGADNTAIQATVTDATATSLTVIVPVGAVSGSVIVRVGEQTSIGTLFTVPVDNPKPVISSISPTGVRFGSTSASVEILGTGFRPSSRVLFDGRDVTPSFQDETLLLISLTENQLSPAIHKAVVLNPAPGGGESNSVDFTVEYPTPSISSISPTEGNAATSIVITGTGFTSMSIVRVDGVPAGGTYVNPTTILITLTPVVTVDRVISVSNPLPGGGNSNSVRFRVTDSLPPPPVTPPPPVPPGPPASSLTVAVQISSGVTPIGSYQVTLTFDPSLVQLSSRNVTGGNGGGFAAGPTTVNIDNRAGTVTLNQFITSNNPSGTFTVANLTFTPIHAGTVNLGLIVNAVTDRLANDVVPPPPLTLVPSSTLIIN
jgi:IPT/TIG domain-containing protein